MKIHKILVCFLIVISSCTNKKEITTSTEEKTAVNEGVVNPEDIGKVVFEIIQDFEEMSIKDFEEKVITYQELQDLANNPKARLGEQFKADFKSITPAIYEQTMQNDYAGLKDTSSKHEIDWYKIQFVEFIHEEMEFDGVKGVQGETYFKNTDNKIYFIKSMAFYDGEKYVIVKMAEIQPSSKH